MAAGNNLLCRMVFSEKPFSASRYGFPLNIPWPVRWPAAGLDFYSPVWRKDVDEGVAFHEPWTHGN